MLVLGSRGSPRVVKFKTLVAEVGLAVSTALGGLQRLGRLTEATHDGYAAQAQRVSVPGGCTWVHRDKCRRQKKQKKKVVIFHLGCSVWCLNSPPWPGYISCILYEANPHTAAHHH